MVTAAGNKKPRKLSNLKQKAANPDPKTKNAICDVRSRLMRVSSWRSSEPRFMMEALTSPAPRSVVVPVRWEDLRIPPVAAVTTEFSIPLAKQSNTSK